MEIIKTQPQSIQAEEAVIGAMLLERKACMKALNILSEDDFYKSDHSKYFKAIQDMYSQGIEVDIITLLDFIKGDGNKAYELTGITSKIGSTAHLEQHCRIIKQLSIRRSMIETANEMIEKCYDDSNDTFDILNESASGLISLNSSITSDKIKHVSRSVKENLEKLDTIAKDPGSLLGYASGISELDKTIHGFQPGMYIVAGRPSMGKSSLASNFINEVAIEQGVPTAIFSMEVDANKFTLRLQTQRSGIHFTKLQTANLNSEEWNILNRESNIITKAPIYIDDFGGLNEISLRSKVLSLYHDKGVRFFVIDFIQLTSSVEKGINDTGSMDRMSRAVKLLTQELRVPIVVLSQLSRSVESEPGNLPKLNHLRQSGSLEQDANVVILLYRPEYYKMEEMQVSKNDIVDSKDMAQLIIAKNKDGATKSIVAKYTASDGTLCFKDYVPENMYSYEN